MAEYDPEFRYSIIRHIGANYLSREDADGDVLVDSMNLGDLGVRVDLPDDPTNLFYEELRTYGFRDEEILDAFDEKYSLEIEKLDKKLDKYREPVLRRGSEDIVNLFLTALTFHLPLQQLFFSQKQNSP